jgi:hypothetical protein
VHLDHLTQVQNAPQQTNATLNEYSRSKDGKMEDSKVGEEPVPVSATANAHHQ